MSPYCKTHVKERTTAELKRRRGEILQKNRELFDRGKGGIGPGLKAELENITKEWQRRQFPPLEEGNENLTFLKDDT